MTDIIKLLPDDEQLEYVQQADCELDEMLVEAELPHLINMKIADLNATNILLIRFEDMLRKAKTNYEWKIINLKNTDTYLEQYKTLKQREEMAKLETRDIQDEILELEKNVQILKSQKQGIEYELRLLFKQMEWEGELIETR